MIKSAKEGIEKSKNEFKKLMEVYNSENIELMLEQSSSKEGSMFANYSDELLNNRNKNWIPMIIKAGKKEPSFFGVGAAHLAGEKGVIKLLRKQGYTVEAVK